MALQKKLRDVQTEIQAEKLKKKELLKKANRPGGLSADDQIELKSCEDNLADL
jgi:hypothetical protein